MNKVELAKMLGLELDEEWELIDDYLPTVNSETKDLIEMSNWCYEKYNFNNMSIEIVVEEKSVNLLPSDFSNYNVSVTDWERYYKDSFVKEYQEMVWELAAEEYLGRVNKLVETIKL